MNLRFGPKRVAYDPSDPEANAIAVTKGYTVVHGAQLSGAEWAAAKRVDAIQPAGQVTPSPKPFSPEGRPLKTIDPADWTPDMRRVVAYARVVAQKIMGCGLHVTITNEATSVVFRSNGRVRSATTPTFQISSSRTSAVMCVSVDVSGRPNQKRTAC